MLIYVFNVFLVNNIWTKKITKINNILPLIIVYLLWYFILFYKFYYIFVLVYEVSVGTKLGGADIIQWQETLNDFMEVSIPEKYKQQSNLNLFFVIRAIGDNGEYISLRNNIVVWRIIWNSKAIVWLICTELCVIN